MPKTAQEWKEMLNLDALPDAEFLADLNALEGDEVVEAGSAAPGTLMTPAEIAAAVVLGSAGAAFRAVRQAQGLSVRAAARAWGVSPGRVSQVEAEDANLYLSTVAETARRMGYRAKLVLEPLNGGPTVEAELSPAPSPGRPPA